MITDPETLIKAKTEAIAELRADARRRGHKYDHEYFAEILREDDERMARGEPSHIDPLAREYVETFRTRRTPAERSQALEDARDAAQQREQTALRLKALLAQPATVDALEGLVANADALLALLGAAPSPGRAPWLKRGR